jgi:hypothetical protein
MIHTLRFRDRPQHAWLRPAIYGLMDGAFEIGMNNS